MEGMKIFKNQELGQVRTVLLNGEPWFVGKDVADILEYGNPRKALADHVDTEDKGVTKCDTLGGLQEMTVINESGLYSLILGSKMPSAKKFKRWITAEVLPSIRKNGGYIAGQESLSDEELMAKALVVAQNKIQEKNRKIVLQQEQIERMKPKEIFADAVTESSTSILIGELAKLICQNGVDIGQNRLFDWMRKNGYLVQSGSQRNMPTQKYIERGIFKVKERNIENPDGSVRITRTTVVTGKGQVYFINKFLKEV